MMENNQAELFTVEESYNLVRLRDSCYEFVKKKYPTPVEDEDYEDYLQMLRDEADLEFCARIRVMADQIEKRILEPQKQTIRNVYGYLTKPKQKVIIVKKEVKAWKS